MPWRIAGIAPRSHVCILGAPALCDICEEHGYPVSLSIQREDVEIEDAIEPRLDLLNADRRACIQRPPVKLRPPRIGCS